MAEPINDGTAISFTVRQLLVVSAVFISCIGLMLGAEWTILQVTTQPLLEEMKQTREALNRLTDAEIKTVRDMGKFRANLERDMAELRIGIATLGEKIDLTNKYFAAQLSYLNSKVDLVAQNYKFPENTSGNPFPAPQPHHQ